MYLKYAVEALHSKNYTPPWDVVLDWMKMFAESLIFAVQNIKPILDYFNFKFDPNCVRESEFYNDIFIKDDPELFFAFESKDVTNQRFLSDIIQNVLTIKKNYIAQILDKGSETILLAFDGWDEYSKLKQETGVSQEV